MNYEFRDLMPWWDWKKRKKEDMLPTEAFYIDAGDGFSAMEILLDGFRTLTVSGRELMGFSINETATDYADGSQYNSSFLEPREIEVQYQLTAKDSFDFREKYNQLMKLLSYRQFKFKFNDEPDYYFIGTVSGVGDVDPGKNQIVSSITIHCSDPYKYAIDSQTLEFSGEVMVDDEKLVYPVIPESIVISADTATHTLTNSNGTWIGFRATAAGDVTFIPSESSVYQGENDVISYLDQTSTLEDFNIINGDTLKIDPAVKTVITYRRRLI